MSSRTSQVIQGTHALVLVLREGALECHRCELISLDEVTALRINGLTIPVEQLAVKSQRKLTKRERKIAATAKIIFTSNCLDVYLTDKQTPAFTIVETSETDWLAVLSHLTPSFPANISTLAEVPVYATPTLENSVKMSRGRTSMRIIYVIIMILLTLFAVFFGVLYYTEVKGWPKETMCKNKYSRMILNAEDQNAPKRDPSEGYHCPLICPDVATQVAKLEGGIWSCE